MKKNITQITIRQPDDWHVHLRDHSILKTVLPYTSAINARAIVMPNLTPPITTIKAAKLYRNRILSCLPPNHHFTPLMTCYLTDFTEPDEIECGFFDGTFTACKLYLVNTTTNSSYGVSNINRISKLLERMQKIDMPLLVHGEISSADIFDREACFIDSIMEPLRKTFPELRIVFEHISTKEATEYVKESNKYLAATITPQHLMFNRNDLLSNPLKPHMYCIPILKHKCHQQALRKIIASGHPRFFLGTDTAPHLRCHKETQYICAGVFSAPVSLSAYAEVFEEMNALQHLEKFCSENGPNFYGLPINQTTIRLVRQPWLNKVIINGIIPFLSDQKLNWRVL
ncbi:dihydroorotase [Candidatus Ishikawella capsulata]|uniref:Dihydroorotase n=1 Tax=Candidatus Ishikawaella capsulata Mpkobe TaxID=476281 RepID=C5WD22_9ENTR|nr:dihydroorotase [Candidatus Ishikawaella capsulata]BAH83228.1 dihydroorotase [Candidatus Ishikawaella capsulata Mpkobe]